MKAQYKSRTSKSLFLGLSLCLLICGTFPLASVGQNAQKYWVYFTDKNGSEFNPQEYFHPNALERREKMGLPVCDSSDFPVSETYLYQLTKSSLEIKAVSRWLNAVCCYLESDQLQRIRSWPFVQKVEASGGFDQIDFASESVEDLTIENSISSFEDKVLKGQIESLNGQLFGEYNLNGEGVRIAVFDVGFTGADENETLAHLFINDQIESTFDFVKNKENVFHHSGHGTAVLSCLAGKVEEKLLGLATGATFLLARTEYNLREPFSEEENWMEAMEWADKNGVDIINSSLGYSDRRYLETELDGKTALVSRAADIAASKGILVVNSAGNEGTSRWQYIVAPADAKGVLSVGGIDPRSGIHADFSSYGPTADLRMKPNVSAYGFVVAATKNSGMQLATGTSFSAPLVSGFAACVLQKNPQWTAQKLFDEIEKSGSLYPYFDYAHGYGIPNAIYFLGEDIILEKESVTFEVRQEEVLIHFKNDNSTAESVKPVLIYYQSINRSGQIEDFSVINSEGADAVTINIEAELCELKMSIEGEFYEIELPCGD